MQLEPLEHVEIKKTRSFALCCAHARRCAGAPTPHHQRHQWCQFPRVRAKTIQAVQSASNSYGRPVHTIVCQRLQRNESFPDCSPLELLQRQQKFNRWAKEHLRTSGCRQMSHLAQTVLKPLSRLLLVNSKFAHACSNHSQGHSSPSPSEQFLSIARRRRQVLNEVPGIVSCGQLVGGCPSQRLLARRQSCPGCCEVVMFFLQVGQNSLIAQGVAEPRSGGWGRCNCSSHVSDFRHMKP